MSVSHALTGFRVGITADRRGEEQALMFRRLGAEVVVGPTLRTLPVADEGRLRSVTEAIIATPPDYVVANTGLGVRTWLARADDWALGDELRRALGRTRIVARGPKASGALRSAGLPIWWRSPVEQLSSVAEHLVATGMAGATVAFQAHGDDREDLTATLRAAGAQVTEVPVYRWELPADDDPAMDLVARCCAGDLDAVTFTAGPAVRNLVGLAGAAGRAPDLLRALTTTTVVGCIGPVCAEVAREEGLAEPIVPEHWRLGSLVRLVSETLVARRRRWLVTGSEVTLAGSLLTVDGRDTHLSGEERRTLTTLALDPASSVLVNREVAGSLLARLGPAAAALGTDDEPGQDFLRLRMTVATDLAPPADGGPAPGSDASAMDG